jgi:hypothetical protein
MKIILSILLSTVLTNVSFAAVQMTEKNPPALPPTWAATSAAQRLQLVRAAQVDAMRLLAESVYGVSLSSDTCIHDIVQAYDRMDAANTAVLRGARTDEPKYHADGRVEVVGTIQLREVIQTIKTTLQASTTVFSARLGVYRLQLVKSVDESKLDRMIEVTGSSAVAGTEGETKLRAKRAAELDAYRQLAEQVLGVTISGQTQVRALALKSDRVRAQFARVIRGAEYEAIHVLPDRSVEVTMRLALADVDRMLRYAVAPGEPVQALTPQQAAQFVTAKGRGVATAEVPPPGQAFEDVAAVIERVVERQVVLTR